MPHCPWVSPARTRECRGRAFSVVMPWTIPWLGRCRPGVGVAADPQHLGGVRELDAVGTGDRDGPLDHAAVPVVHGDVIRAAPHGAVILAKMAACRPGWFL